MIRPKNTFPQNLCPEEVAHPDRLLNEFYSIYDISSAKKHLAGWLKTVHEHKKWKKECPSNVLFFHDSLIRLLEAAWLINQLKYTEGRAILNEQVVAKDIASMKTELIGKYGYDEKLWRLYPDNLTWKEFINPYKALPKIFEFRTLSEWTQALHEMLHIAISENNGVRIRKDIDVLGFKKHLNKLMNASYLIYSRELKIEDIKNLMQVDGATNSTTEARFREKTEVNSSEESEAETKGV